MVSNTRLASINSQLTIRPPGIFTQKSSILAAKSNPGKSVFSASTTKRPFEPPSIFDQFDSENIDPTTSDSPPKKSKNAPFTFALSPVNAMAPPPFTPMKANMSSPRAPLTAPAGRSPTKRGKTAVGIGKARRVSAPFSRIDPPFASRGQSTLPFSLDAALHGTFSTPLKSKTPSAGATIQESMPKAWSFDIYEDHPEEEAANLMEHSTLTLDLSSDDEGTKKDVDDRGKENIAPAGYDAPSRAGHDYVGGIVAAVEIVRRKVASDEMDDGLRSPLSDLETDCFIPQGLDKESCVVVAEADGVIVAERREDIVSTEQTGSISADESNNGQLTSSPQSEAVVDDKKNERDDPIVVFEDEQEPTVTTTVLE